MGPGESAQPRLGLSTGKTKKRKVTALIIGYGEKHLVELTVDVDGKKGTKVGTLTVTEGHPFWSPDLKKWVKAGDLKRGAMLKTSAGTHVQVTAIQKWTAQRQQVRNLTVDGLHTYYVLAGNMPVLVHNAGCDEWAAAFAKRNGGETKTFVGPGGDQLPMGPYRPKGPGTPELDESWFHHTVVVREGKVHDQWHTGGIDIDEYKTRFDYGEDMDFGF